MNDPPTPVVACPTCKRPCPFSPRNRWRPFCSERCRAIDLGAWANEAYRVPGDEPTDAELPTDTPREDRR